MGKFFHGFRGFEKIIHENKGIYMVHTSIFCKTMKILCYTVYKVVCNVGGGGIYMAHYNMSTISLTDQLSKANYTRISTIVSEVDSRGTAIILRLA